MDTKGVIARVSKLFENHKELLLGFNHFLPPGFRIELPPAKPQPELAHARSYVKKIKARFSAQSHVYKSFLEILHTFLNKEQHTVYERVAVLFADHPDLLEEFTQFLPDTSSGGQQALGTAADTVSAAAAASAPALMAPGKAKGTIGVSGGVPSGPTLSRKSKEPHSGGMVDSNQRKGKRSKKEEDMLPEDEEIDAADKAIRNRRFFSQLKKKLDNNDIYDEILKVLHLFNEDVLSYAELTLLLRDLLDHRPDLYHRFRHFSGMGDVEQPSGFDLRDFDLRNLEFSSSKRYGPSYRANPKSYKPLHCSGRTLLCDQVLNDTWVSSPTGSEDVGFKASRKNQYEEELFKCEDQRCELDLAIELNWSAIFALESILKRMRKATEDEKKRFRIADGELKILHVRAIEKLYGDRGAEVVEGLFSNPVSAVPVVLRRLRQKDLEWRRSRREFQKVWREINEKNFFKSLDHQGAYFKQAEKKTLSPKVYFFSIYP